MLSIETINVHYRGVQALFNISLDVHDNEFFALLGRNGAGKTTLLKSCVGLLPISSGHIIFKGREIAKMQPSKMCSLGMGFVFQERSVFQELTVTEHLRLAITKSFDGKKLDDAINETVKLFPDLERRLNARAGTLSGGEAQMLEISMALVRRPRLLLLDEPSQGLSSINIRRFLEKLNSLRHEMAVFISEQNIKVALELGDRFAVIRDGSIVFRGSRDDLQKGGDEIVKRYILS